MVNKGSSFADFVRFRPHIYARTQQQKELSRSKSNPIPFKT